MTNDEAYRKGQEDMKRRLAVKFAPYYMRPISAHDNNIKCPDVPVRIRAMKIKSLLSEERDV